jgi:hypothetical protein
LGRTGSTLRSCEASSSVAREITTSASDIRERRARLSARHLFCYLAQHRDLGRCVPDRAGVPPSVALREELLSCRTPAARAARMRTGGIGRLDRNHSDARSLGNRRRWSGWSAMRQDHCLTRKRFKRYLASTRPVISNRFTAILAPLPLPMSCHLCGVRAAYSRAARIFLPNLTLTPCGLMVVI